MKDTFDTFLSQQLRGAWDWVRAVFDTFGRSQTVATIVIAVFGLAAVAGYWALLLTIIKPASEALFWGGVALFFVLAIEVGAYRAWRSSVRSSNEALAAAATAKAELQKVNDTRPRGRLKVSTTASGHMVVENDTDMPVYWADWELLNGPELNVNKLKTTMDPFPIEVFPAHTSHIVRWAVWWGMRRPFIRTRWKDAPDAAEWQQVDWHLSW